MVEGSGFGRPGFISGFQHLEVDPRSARKLDVNRAEGDWRVLLAACLALIS